MPTNRCIEITAVSKGNLMSALEAVRGCWKAATILWLHAMKLPVLSGVIVTEWSSVAARTIRKFCQQKGVGELLLRIDRPGKRWTERRGGYVISTAQVVDEVSNLFEEGMIAILLEPASPYNDYYGIGAVYTPDDERLLVEVVGPGFDASDILRSDVQPHERFEVTMRRPERGPQARMRHSIRRTYLVDTSSYVKSVESRLAKIGARIENPAFPARHLSLSTSSRHRLIQDAKAFLKKTGQNLLRQHVGSYSPIPPKYLRAFISGVLELLDRLADYGIDLGTTSISASVIGDRRLVFWDFFPARIRDTGALATALK